MRAPGIATATPYWANRPGVPNGKVSTLPRYQTTEDAPDWWRDRRAHRGRGMLVR